MNTFFSKVSMFLANTVKPLSGQASGGSTPTTPTTPSTGYTPKGWVKVVIDAVEKVLNPILIIAALVGVIYAIWVGITFAKADSADQRKEAKQKLLTVITGIGATLALIVLFYWLIYMIEAGKIHFSWLSDNADYNTNK